LAAGPNLYYSAAFTTREQLSFMVGIQHSCLMASVYTIRETWHAWVLCVYSP